MAWRKFLDTARANSSRQRREARIAAEPGPGGKPIYEWLEVRPFLAGSPTVTE